MALLEEVGGVVGAFVDDQPLAEDRLSAPDATALPAARILSCSAERRACQPENSVARSSFGGATVNPAMSEKAFANAGRCDNAAR